MAQNDSMDMQRMQQDAIRRVREMQSRAQHSLNGANREQNRGDPHRSGKPGQSAPPSAAKPGPAPRQETAQTEPPPKEPALPPGQAPMQETPATDLLNGLLQDGERTLILVLILLLVSEKADTYLIFALMYLVVT